MEKNIPQPCTLKRMAKGLKTSSNEIMQLAGYTEITSSNRKINSYTENKIDLGNLIDDLLVATKKETQAELWGQHLTWKQKKQFACCAFNCSDHQQYLSKKTSMVQ